MAVYMADPDKVAELSEKEKMECTVRWLNHLYRSYSLMLWGEMTAEEFLESPSPCYPDCPYSKKCPSTARDPYRPTVPIPINFKVLEQFTPGLSVEGPILRPRDTRDGGIVFPKEPDCN